MTLEPILAMRQKTLSPEPSPDGKRARPKAGLYATVPEWAAKMPMLHQSTAAEIMNRSPLHGWYKAFKEGPEEWDDARNFGQVCHKVLLGGKELVVVDAPDWRTSKAKQERDAALEMGKIPVRIGRYAEAVALVNIVTNALSESWRIILTGQNELTAVWHKNQGWCCGRLDHLIFHGPKTRPTGAMILDFKFTSSAAKKQCENRFIEHGYDIQHAAYVEAIATIYPKLAGRVKMQFIFVEVNAPNAIRLMPLAGSMRTSGEIRWNKAREKWRECLEKYGQEKPWPAYSDDGEPAECPPWAMNRQIAEMDNFQPEGSYADSNV